MDWKYSYSSVRTEGTTRTGTRAVPLSNPFTTYKQPGTWSQRFYCVSE